LRSESKFWSNGTVPWFTVEDIRNQGKVIYSTQQHITEEAITADRIVPANSFLLCCTASVGVYAQTKIPLTTNQQFNALTVKNSHKGILIDEYLFGIGEYFSSLLHSAAGKTTFEFVSVKKLGAFLIPVPPKKEQQRIIDALQEFDPVLKDYDKLEQQATKLDTEIYDKLKKSILQYAIQGKLVEQDENDEPASILLERICTEKKAQLGKKYIESYIYKGDDNCYYEKVGKNEPVLIEDLPFDIPDTWAWARLKDVVEINPRNSVDDETMVSFVEMKSLKDGFNNSFVVMEFYGNLVKTIFKECL
jgi:type I restriction enzyme S subunit